MMMMMMCGADERQALRRRGLVGQYESERANERTSTVTLQSYNRSVALGGRAACSGFADFNARTFVPACIALRCTHTHTHTA